MKIAFLLLLLHLLEVGGRRGGGGGEAVWRILWGWRLKELMVGGGNRGTRLVLLRELRRRFEVVGFGRLVVWCGSVHVEYVCAMDL